MHLDGVGEEVAPVDLGHLRGYFLSGQRPEEEDDQSSQPANPHTPVRHLGALQPD
jgi:hypothetical protein